MEDGPAVEKLEDARLQAGTILKQVGMANTLQTSLAYIVTSERSGDDTGISSFTPELKGYNGGSNGMRTQE